MTYNGGVDLVTYRLLAGFTGLPLTLRQVPLGRDHSDRDVLQLEKRVKGRSNGSGTHPNLDGGIHAYISPVVGLRTAYGKIRKAKYYN